MQEKATKENKVTKEHNLSSYWLMRKDVITKHKIVSFVLAFGMAIHIWFFRKFEWEWYGTALSIIPSLMACSSAIYIGYMCMALGKFYEDFCLAKKHNSPFMVIMSEATCYFLIFIATLMIAIARQSGILESKFVDFIGVFLTCYSATIFIAYIMIFRFIIRIAHIHINKGNVMHEK